MASSLIEAINTVVAPLRRKVDLMVTRAIIKAIKYDNGLQFAQLDLLTGETKDEVEQLQEYGFASSPPVGANAITLFVAGERAHGVVIATDDSRYKPELEPGETAVYTKFGDIIKFTKDGEIIVTASSKVLITAPDVEVDGNFKVTGTTVLEGHLQVNDDIDATGDIIAQGDIDDADRTLAAMVSGYNPHTHGGVQSGGSTTSGPTPTVP